jgi:acyl-CoA synthetase (AMP-forming)/AMP-acid ligase II
MNTIDFLNISAAICPERDAIVFEDRRITFSQLSERTNRLAHALTGLGVTRGDRVATLQVNCNQHVEICFAAARLGAIYVPLNFRAREEELTYILNSGEPKVLFTGDRYVDLTNTIRPKVPSVTHYVSLESRFDEMLAYEEVLASGKPDELVTEVDDNETCMLVNTAGTIGFPKGVMLSHNSFSVYVLENVTPADPDNEERNILTVPLYHVAGLQAVMAAIYGGRTLVMERQFEPKEWMGLVQREKANRAMMVPTMLKQLIDHSEFHKYNLSSLKVITYGAAPMPLEVITRALDLFPDVSFINAFGQTETASTITALNPADHVITGTGEERTRKLKRLASIGKPMPDVEMKVIDEDGNTLPVGEVGEIVARGPRVMSGYWKDEEKTRKAIDADGWVHTGDMGYVDEDGYYYLAGRSSDIIIRAGENISPEEVEAAIRTQPAVDDVAVIGVQDEEWGEVPRAVVVLKSGQTATAEEIMEHCRQKLASYKRPRSVVFTDELPRNPLGKVLKRVLREQYGQV